MAIRFLDAGTDQTQDFTFWSATAGTAASDTGTKHTGTSAIKLSVVAGVNAHATSYIGALTGGTGRLSFWYRRNATLANFDTVLENGEMAVDIREDGTGKFFLWNGAASSAGTAVLAVDTWYRVALCWNITNTTTFEFRLYVNGVLDITYTTGTLASATSTFFRFWATGADGNNLWFDSIYADDSGALTDPGNATTNGLCVTAKLPAANNVNGFDINVGANPANRWTNVNQRALSTTDGWEHRGVGFVAAGSLATNATTTSMAITAPSCSVNDILVAYIYGNNNQVVSAPDGTWTSIKEINNTANMRSSIFWKRAVSGSSGAAFTFTKPVDDNLLFAGLIVAYKGIRTNATAIDGTAASSSANASSDSVTYATFDPTETNAFVIANGQYANDLTTAGAMSGTDPTFTKQVDVETTAGNDCSIFVYDGISSGAATGSRTHGTASTADAINTGIQFGLVPQAQENYTLQAASVGDVDLTTATIIGRGAWVYAKASDTTGSPTAGIVDNGSVTGITLTTVAALYTAFTTSSTYPSNAAGIGLRSTGTVNDTFLYECGTLIAYSGGINKVDGLAVTSTKTIDGLAMGSTKLLDGTL